jgi:hypothetical protein
MKHVIIVNGKPESGKTTFEMECRDTINGLEYAHCHIVSSIDPIKEIYRKLGWNGNKTEKARRELSILKKMWSENCNGSIKYIVNYVLKLDNKEDHVIFVDIREEAEIIELSEILQALYVIDIRCTKLLITRAECNLSEYGNKSDDMVGTNISIYDRIIKNDTDKTALYDKAHDFVDSIFGIIRI